MRKTLVGSVVLALVVLTSFGSGPWAASAPPDRSGESESEELIIGKEDVPIRCADQEGPVAGSWVDDAFRFVGVALRSLDALLPVGLGVIAAPRG